MKTFAVITILTVMLAISSCLAGCALWQDKKDDIHAAIIEYVETKGQDAAIAYVDKLASDGRLGSVNAEKIKSAIPGGIEKLKAVLEDENE